MLLKSGLQLLDSTPGVSSTVYTCTRVLLLSVIHVYCSDATGQNVG